MTRAAPVRAPAAAGTASRRRIAIVVPDGMGIRNFLCGRLVRRLALEHDVIVVHALPGSVCEAHRLRLPDSVSWVRLPETRETVRERFYRGAKVHARLRRSHRGTALRALLAGHRAPARWKPRLLEGASRLAGRICANDRGVRLLDRRHAAAARANARFGAHLGLVRDLAPDLVFLTHQRASVAVPFLLAARDCGVPTASFIYSWDNVPKGRLAVHADHFLVWSASMRDELLRFHPQIRPDRVHVTGTPQFEAYCEPRRVRPRAEYLGSLGLDPARRAMLFSGDDVATSPFDHVFLDDVAGALRAIPEPWRPQLIFRRCPADTGARYAEVLRRHPEVAVAPPRWTVPEEGNWTQAVPDAADLDELASLVEHCDAVVNFASTMSMDFAVQDKPALYLRYEVDPARRWSVEQIYGLPHFESVHRLQPVHWIRSREEIAKTLLHVLGRPGERAPARRAWIEGHLALPLEQATSRIHRTLLGLANKPCTSVSS